MDEDISYGIFRRPPCLEGVENLSPQEVKSQLAIIFNELGAETFRERRAIGRGVLRALYNYWYVLDEEVRAPTADYFRQWREGLARHSKAIVDLLEAVPDSNKPDFFEDLGLVAHRPEELLGRGRVPYPPPNSTAELWDCQGTGRIQKCLLGHC